MDQEFIRLMQILLGNHGNTIAGYGTAINVHVANLNGCLNQNFIGDHPCPPIPSSPVIAPVVFSSSGEEPVFAVFGLNPLFNVKNNSVCKEKSLAGNNLSDYAAFYNSKSCNTNGVFPLVFNPIEKYYRNVLTVYLSLIFGKFFLFDKFKTKYKNSDDQVSWIISKVLNCPIIVPEFIPFHSKATGSISLSKLYGCNLNYENYHKELLTVLKDRISLNGIILSNGQASSKTLKRIIPPEDILDSVDYGDPLSHTLAIWNDRLVIILNDFLGRRGRDQRFRNQTQLKNLIRDVITYCKEYKHKLPQHPCKCNDTINSSGSIDGNYLYNNDDDLFEDLFHDVEDESLKDHSLTKMNRSDSKTLIPVVPNPLPPVVRGHVIPIPGFSGSIKGLSIGDYVEFPANKQRGIPNPILIRGTIVKIFRHHHTGKEEAIIKGDDGIKYYRYEKEITKLKKKRGL